MKYSSLTAPNLRMQQTWLNSYNLQIQNIVHMNCALQKLLVSPLQKKQKKKTYKKAHHNTSPL